MVKQNPSSMRTTKVLDRLHAAQPNQHSGCGRRIAKEPFRRPGRLT